MREYRCLIGGEWRGSSSGRTVAVHNPATHEVLGAVPSLASNEIADAIEAAAQAFTSWRDTTARNRSDLLHALAHAVTDHADDLAHTITAEQGKPLAEARGEVAYSANYFRWFAGEAVRINGDIIPSDSQNGRIFVLKQPIGPVAAITPWNFPLAMLARKLGAALAAGCTFLVKPAPETPLSALKLAELCVTVGLPPGVVNVVTGDAPMIGEAIMSSPVIRKVSFTGSCEVGKLLIKQSADTVKKLTLELGGNAPFIVREDADLDLAVEGAIFGKYRNAGQTCICVNRFLVHTSVAARFTEKLIARSKALIVGNGADPATTIGPLISDEAVAKVERLIASARDAGACIALAPTPHPNSRRFMAPTVITNVLPSMSIWNEEIFGPVSCVTTFSNDDEAITLANSTPYGLAAYLYSRDLSRALSLTERLDFGMVGINETSISAVQAPFGGVKESGYGREGSRYGIDEYLALKYVAVKG